MAFAEDDLVPLSALQHWVFCERQCALIHLEQSWQENPLTLEGRHLHEAVDRGGGESRGPVRLLRSVALRSLRLGLAGRSDVVELQALPRGATTGVALPGLAGRWRVVPVEHKRGRPKHHQADLVQLCAQALCLEEMLGTTIEAGVLFYGQTRRRLDVPFDAALRATTEEAARALHALFTSRQVPPARYAPRCESCSLLETCRPRWGERSAATYLARATRAALAEDPP